MVGPLLVVFFDYKTWKTGHFTTKKTKIVWTICWRNLCKTCFKANVSDQLLEFLYSYHPKINLTYEINPKKFFNTKICYSNSSNTNKVHHGVIKLTPHWPSSILKRYKWNAVHRDLCGAECILSNFNNEKILIRQKFDNAGYPSPLTNSVIRDYGHKQNKRR